MNAIPIFAFTIALCVFHKCSAGIPSDVQKCRAGDVMCMAKITTDILRRYPNGNKGLGLRNLEPFHLDELVVAKTHGDQPLNLDLKFTDLDVYGLSKANITRMVGFGKDPRKTKFEVYLTVPRLTLRGQYEANGRILLLPIVGQGTAEIQFKNFKSGVKLKISTEEENGNVHIAISKMKVQNDPEMMKVQFDNLFNGNKPLGDEINKVVNANWKDVWTELESGINEGYTQIVRFLLSDVLKAISYDDFFAD